MTFPDRCCFELFGPCTLEVVFHSIPLSSCIFLRTLVVRRFAAPDQSGVSAKLEATTIVEILQTITTKRCRRRMSIEDIPSSVSLGSDNSNQVVSTSAEAHSF